MPSSHWLHSHSGWVHIYSCSREAGPCTRKGVAVTHKVHPDGGGRRCLDFCADVFDEGVFVLVVDDDLGSRGCHQEGVVVRFVYVQNNLQS